MLRRLREWRSALERPGVRKVAGNTLWLFLDRGVRLGVGFVVGALVARYLGPEVFGRFSYVAAFVTLFGTVIAAGTDTVVVRDLAKEPLRADRILSAAILIRLATTPLVLAAIAAAAWWMHAGDGSTLQLVAVFSLTLLFRPVDVVDLWFQAETNSRPVVWARSLAFFAGAAAKVGLVFAGASLLGFVWVEPAVAALGALLLLAAYRADGRRWTVVGASTAEVRRLLSAGAPLLLSGVAVMVYMRIDQVMLEHLSGGGAQQVGLYSAAQRLSEVWYFLPMSLANSVFPTLVRSREVDPSRYLGRLERLFSIMAAVSIAAAAATTLLSAWIIQVVFGPAYAGAEGILSIHVWTAFFVFWGVVGDTWSLNEGLTRLTLYRTASAAVANVLLNLVLIPRYGGVGAAVATLVSQAWSSWLSNLLWTRTRPLFMLQARSLLFRSVFR